jgi:putative endonuclease
MSALWRIFRIKMGLLEMQDNELNSSAANWSVYLILCSDNSLYAGITNNLQRRFNQHSKKQGAKYFRGRDALSVVYVDDGHSRSSASKREFAIKKLNRSEKLSLISSETNCIDKYKF